MFLNFGHLESIDGDKRELRKVMKCIIFAIMEGEKIEQALYMLPVTLSDGSPRDVLPLSNFAIMTRLRHFIVENVRTARRFLRACQKDFPIDECTFYELNGHTDRMQLSSYLNALRKGTPMGLMSEAGCPGIADPGADIVALAQREGLRVIPMVGPSSILMSLMASGFNGQGFIFRGYLPVKTEERAKAIKDLETAARRSHVTQIFIETPYRNDVMMRQLTELLHPDTMLCVAVNVTADDEDIRSRSVAQWRKNLPVIGKRPAIFLINI